MRGLIFGRGRAVAPDQRAAPTFPDEPASGTRLVAPAASFPVCLCLDARGQTMARGPAEEMTRLMNREGGSSVVRESDGALLATAQSFRGETFWGPLWALRREPDGVDL